MSTCISRHGEYSDHEPGDWCPRCGAFNEDAIVAERDQLRAAVDDERSAKRIAADCADRFRDVVSEALGLTENPGDDELVRMLRERHGHTGPEPRRWRDFATGAIAHLEREGHRWVADVALDGPTEGAE